MQLACTKSSPGNSVTLLDVLNVDEVLRVELVLSVLDDNVLLVLRVLVLRVLLLISALKVL
jgi:hypothetical protein